MWLLPFFVLREDDLFLLYTLRFLRHYFPGMNRFGSVIVMAGM